MGKPIGQTFYVNEPPPPLGAAGVFLTKVDIFFKEVSDTYGIELQIRKTENGLPTASRLPFATKVLPAANCVASNTAALATTFEFDTPVFLPSNDLYALVLMPVGGNPDYLAWTGTISETDISTNTPIFVNNSTGDLFISSNDLSWQPVYNEDLKFNLYIANFTSTTGKAYFRSPNEEWFVYRNLVGNFIPRETIYFGNTPATAVVFNISSLSGTFTAGDTAYQGNSSYIVKGIVTSANSTVIKLKNTTGAFSNTTLFNANAAANCVANVVLQYNSTTATSNVISVPDSSLFAAGNSYIYVQTNNRSNTYILKVTSIVNSTAIQVNSAVAFTDSAATVGRLIANGYMYGKFSGGSLINGNYYTILDASSANSTVNLANASFSNCQVIGSASGASAWLKTVFNAPYDSLTPHFLTAIYANTSIDWYLKGTRNDGSYTRDANTSISINNEAINEFTDYKRIAMSKSNELTTVLGSNGSLVIETTMQTQNTKISPVIDTIRSSATITSNILSPEADHTGYKLTYILTGANTIADGATITSTSWGNTATGTVLFSNSTVMTVSGVNGKFTNTTFTATGGVAGYITNAVEYAESKPINYYFTSRYISKNVILAADQDSEDMITYLTAYRPAGTNFMVFAKILNTADNDLFRNKAWSRMYEASSPQLFSATGSIDDQLEIQYTFPTSQRIYISNTVCNTTSANVTVNSTQYLSKGSCIYFGEANGFNVRKVVYVTNTTSVVVDRAPSFVSGNANMGIIPGLEDSTAAFLYDQGNNVVRYVTSSDAIYDRYIQFAIKIVPIGNNSLIVPRCADVRTLALQV